MGADYELETPESYFPRPVIQFYANARIPPWLSKALQI